MIQRSVVLMVNTASQNGANSDATVHHQTGAGDGNGTWATQIETGRSNLVCFHWVMPSSQPFNRHWGKWFFPTVFLVHLGVGPCRTDLVYSNVVRFAVHRYKVLVG